MKYRKIVKVEFTDYDEEALEKSWKWLNDPEIKYLTDTPDFDKKTQKEWFESIEQRDDYYIKAMKVNDKIVGACGLKNITQKDGEVWLYIGDKSLWGKSIAPQAIDHIISYAKKINLKSIFSITLEDNRSSLAIALRYGCVYDGHVGDGKIRMKLKL